ncbi:hypothetical protein DAEQUDRAFT_132105 [Daedalea quercina L-15889]|uniref:Uncharacterized protein n=1 Tax=Daedalea quercina L-15889 TaxID=1314783 RepID=A0A165KQB8_9APHY|nr:hypothetical protein DAEQUDRAFT_132105 [Daedalea quercina L-15889]
MHLGLAASRHGHSDAQTAGSSRPVHGCAAHQPRPRPHVTSAPRECETARDDPARRQKREASPPGLQMRRVARVRHRGSTARRAAAAVPASASLPSARATSRRPWRAHGTGERESDGDSRLGAEECLGALHATATLAWTLERWPRVPAGRSSADQARSRRAVRTTPSGRSCLAPNNLNSSGRTRRSARGGRREAAVTSSERGPIDVSDADAVRLYRGRREWTAGRRPAGHARGNLDMLVIREPRGQHDLGRRRLHGMVGCARRAIVVAGLGSIGAGHWTLDTARRCLRMFARRERRTDVTP